MRYADVTTLEDAFAWLAERNYLVEVKNGEAPDRWLVVVYPALPTSDQIFAVKGTATTSLEALREAIRGWDDFEAGKIAIGVKNWGPT